MMGIIRLKQIFTARSLRQLEFYLVTTTGTAQGKGNSKVCEGWGKGREEGKQPCSALYSVELLGCWLPEQGQNGECKWRHRDFGIKAQAMHGERWVMPVGVTAAQFWFNPFPAGRKSSQAMS